MSDIAPLRMPRTCPKCHGAKHDMRFGEPCKRCNGTGYVFDHQPDDHIPSLEAAILQVELEALRDQLAIAIKALEAIADEDHLGISDDPDKIARRALNLLRNAQNRP